MLNSKTSVGISFSVIDSVAAGAVGLVSVTGCVVVQADVIAAHRISRSQEPSFNVVDIVR